MLSVHIIKFVNKLLGQEILPVHNKEWLKYCRMTKLKYGVRPQLSISFQDSYVIVEPRLHTSSNEETVDWTQVLLHVFLNQLTSTIKLTPMDCIFIHSGVCSS